MCIYVPGYLVFPGCTDIYGFCVLATTATTMTWKQKQPLSVELMSHFLLYSG